MKVLTPEIVDGRIVVRETDGEPTRGGSAPCPFHGLVGNRHGLLMGDRSGNACALAFAHAPCSMELDGEAPAWDACRFHNTPETKPVVDAVIDRCTVVVTGSGSGPELPAADWFSQVMGRPYRPAN